LTLQTFTLPVPSSGKLLLVTETLLSCMDFTSNFGLWSSFSTQTERQTADKKHSIFETALAGAGLACHSEVQSAIQKRDQQLSRLKIPKFWQMQIKTFQSYQTRNTLHYSPSMPSASSLLVNLAK